MSSSNLTSPEMTPEVRALVHRTSIVSATLGVLMSPIPLLDELVLIPVFGVLARRIARRHALARGQVPWRPILKTTAVGLVARGAVNITVAAVPGVSAVAAGATAVALTEILGDYVDRACRDPAQAKPLKVREVVDMIQRAVRKKQQKPVAQPG